MLNEEGRLILTPEVWQTIKDVNKDGNKVEWADDRKLWGEIEKWEFPKEVGRKKLEDCDGITLYKMRSLLEKGLPVKCLLFTCAFTEEDEAHAVLTIITDRGDYILDNRYDKVMGYDDLVRIGYRFLFRTRDGKLSANWVKIIP